eukprot:3741549-Pleurochrysis_carterae.AAC.1
MGRAIDLLEARMEAVVEEGVLLLDEGFAVAIFRTLELELPPLAEYLSYTYSASVCKSQARLYASFIMLACVLSYFCRGSKQTRRPTNSAPSSPLTPATDA